MKVRDLTCWPPKWRGASSGSGSVIGGEVGILTAIRWDLENRVPTLTMEYEGARHVAVLDGDTGLLTKLYLLLGWHVGQALEKIGSLEMTPLASRLSPTR